MTTETKQVSPFEMATYEARIAEINRQYRKAFRAYPEEFQRLEDWRKTELKKAYDRLVQS